MPNNIVFNGAASQLQAQVNGVTETGLVQPIQTDAEGRLSLATLTAHVSNTVTASIANTVSITAQDFDIRPLSGATDSLQVSNTVTASVANTVSITAQDFDIRRLSGATDSFQLSSRLFTETSTTLDGVTDSAAILLQNTSEENMYSFYVFNTGANTVTVNLQISPTTTDSYFADDISGTVAVGPNEKEVLVASEFLKYTRLFYETAGDAVTFDAFYNAHI